MWAELRASMLEHVTNNGGHPAVGSQAQAINALIRLGEILHADYTDWDRLDIHNGDQAEFETDRLLKEIYDYGLS